MVHQIQGMYCLVDHASAAGSVPFAPPGLYLIIFFFAVPGNRPADAGNGSKLAALNQSL